MREYQIRGVGDLLDSPIYNALCEWNSVNLAGGETRVRGLLENHLRKQLSGPLLQEQDEDEEEGKACNEQYHSKSIRDFFVRPSRIGKDLLSIEKFGLVQYVLLLLASLFILLCLLVWCTSKF